MFVRVKLKFDKYNKFELFSQMILCKRIKFDLCHPLCVFINLEQFRSLEQCIFLQHCVWLYNSIKIDVSRYRFRHTTCVLQFIGLTGFRYNIGNIQLHESKTQAKFSMKNEET